MRGKRSSGAPRVNLLQKNPRRSPALRRAAARWYVNPIARIPLARTTHIRWEPWRHGNRFACVCVCVRVCAWGCNLRATRAGLSFGALKAKAKPLTCGWSLAFQGWLGGLPRGTRCCPAPVGCQGAGGGSTWVLPPPPCPRAALDAQHPWVSLQVLIPPRQETPLRFLGRCIFCSWHMDCLGVHAKRRGGLCFGKPGSSLKNPHSFRAKRGKKTPAAMPAGRLCSAINRRCLFYTNLLHRTTESRSRFLRVQAISASATCADASGLCLGSFVLLWYVELLSDKMFQAGVLREEETKGVGC